MILRQQIQNGNENLEPYKQFNMDINYDVSSAYMGMAPEIS
jgi:hypothetical protein